MAAAVAVAAVVVELVAGPAVGPAAGPVAADDDLAKKVAAGSSLVAAAAGAFEGGCVGAARQLAGACGGRSMVGW